MANSYSAVVCRMQIAPNPSALVWFEVTQWFIIRIVYIFFTFPDFLPLCCPLRCERMCVRESESYFRLGMWIIWCNTKKSYPECFYRALIWDQTEQFGPGSNRGKRAPGWSRTSPKKKGQVIRFQISFKDEAILVLDESEKHESNLEPVQKTPIWSQISLQCF